VLIICWVPVRTQLFIFVLSQQLLDYERTLFGVNSASLEEFDYDSD
jgi:hypothetical protein